MLVLFADWCVSLTAGKLALICDDCVEACINGRWSGAVIDGEIAGDVVCAFCGLTRLAVPKFGASGFFICGDCATWYWEEAIRPDWRPYNKMHLTAQANGAPLLIPVFDRSTGRAMESDDRTHKLLEEIRDVQREHLTE